MADPQRSTTLHSTYDPTNIDSPGFDPDAYVTKLLRETRLTQLIDKEQLLTKQIKTLDNEMQSLVYENYNKFISATDTIRQMKKDFKTMEDEMTHLISTMSTINTNNHQIHQTLDNRRHEIRKLTSIHLLLHKLQYLFQLPTKLKEYADDNQYDLAVHTYTKALKALQKYSHISSFNHIQQTCIETMNSIRDELKSRFDQQETTSGDVVKLLLQLGESSDYLAKQYLEQHKSRLQQPLDLMKQQLIVAESQLTSTTATTTQKYPMDILEFVDTSYNSYIKNLHDFLESYEHIFLRDSATTPVSPNFEDETKERCKHYLEEYFLELYSSYIQFIHELFQSKYYGQDNDIQLYVRAVDRFLRRSMNDIHKYLFTQQALEKLRTMLEHFLIFTIECRLKFSHALIDRHFHEQILELRKSLSIIQSSANEQTIQTDRSVAQQTQMNLTQSVDKMLKQLTNDIKYTFQNLSIFFDGTEMIGNMGKKTLTAKQFATDHVWNAFFLVLLQRLIEYFESEYTNASNYSSSTATTNKHEQNSPPILLLMLSKLILNFDSSSIPYLCTVFEEKFNLILENIPQNEIHKHSSSIDRSSLTSIQKQFSILAKQLLKQYICSQGYTLSQMLRKSIETRDWLNTIEPRHVRSVMKRIIEDLTQIDKQVFTLYNDQSTTSLSTTYGRYNYRSNLTSSGARSSDGGRRTIIMPRSSALDRGLTGGTGSSAGSTGNLQMNFHRVFNEKLDIFIDLQFQKTSILSSIIKLLLKTYLECIRLKTFSRYGLQQVQVDINYLYNYLWSFVNNDDRFITNLLEEILSSTAMRCLDPVLMEASVITVICEGN